MIYTHLNLMLLSFVFIITSKMAEMTFLLQIIVNRIVKNALYMDKNQEITFPVQDANAFHRTKMY